MGHGLRSSISLPLRTDGRVIGAMNIYTSRPGVFGPSEQLVAGRFADEAFDMPRTISQNRNVKLRDIATEMVTAVSGHPPADEPRFS
jgi:LytS/YehU family sensor histidine kinase